MKHPHFDFGKYSLLEYIEMFKEFYITGTSFIPFEYTRLDRPNCILELSDGSVLAIEKNSFAYFPVEPIPSTCAIRYSENKNNCTLHLHGTDFYWRKSKGITYKDMSLGEGKVSIARNRQQNRVSVWLPDSFAFHTYKYKKFTKHTMLVYTQVENSTGNYSISPNLELQDKQRANGSTRESYGLIRSCTINGVKDNFLEVRLKETPKKGIVEMVIGISFKKKQKFLLKMPDASIEHLFNPEYMFEFDLLADQEAFVLLETFRTDAIKHIKEALKVGGTSTVLNSVLQNITKD